MSKSTDYGSACPYLGLPDDSRTSLAYPSIWNLCYRIKAPASIILSHQTGSCLSANFENCPAYRAPEGSVSLPVELNGSVRIRSRNVRGRQTLVRLFLILLLAGLMAAGIYWVQNNGGLFTGNLSSARQTSPASAAVARTSIVLIPVTSAISPVTGDRNLELTATASQVSATRLVFSPTEMYPSTAPAVHACGQQLDVPFGADVKFVLHRIAYGENLTKFALQYQTTEQAIIGINYRLPIPIWADRVVVIPVGVENVGELPVFEAYQHAGAALSMQELTHRLQSDSEVLQKYNAFDEKCTLYSGWLIVARQAEIPEE